MPEAKPEQIERVKANLPLPEQPPKLSDWNSADARTVNGGSGRLEGPIGKSNSSTAGLRGPATKRSEDMDMSKIGRQGVDGLENTPKDARTR